MMSFELFRNFYLEQPTGGIRSWIWNYLRLWLTYVVTINDRVIGHYSFGVVFCLELCYQLIKSIVLQR